MLSEGTELGPYRIRGPLGSGGMGEVYRARDTRLDRDVAIKVLPEAVAADPRALARFEREAKAVAALSHPNILAIHDIGEERGIRFAVTELLDGETLRERLARERLSWRKSVEIGIAMAEGLSAAHAKGIVHRDLKPDNVFLTSAGLVKILDFGLARAEAAPAAGATSAPTAVASLQTEAGAVLGTVGYMSPEQVGGESADARSDIFSFGCVLYEMLSGRRAFGGESRGQTLAAILRDQPPELSRSGVELPAGLDRVVARCLEKSPDERFQTARDLAFALKEASGSPISMPPSVAPIPPPVPAPRPHRVWLAVLIAAAVIAGLYVLNPGGLRTRLSPPAADRVQSLAVLPLANLSGDPKEDYFADGMTEELITDLSKISNLRVTSRTSVMGLKSTKKKIPELARDMGVAFVVEGSVVRQGSKVRVTAQLIDGASDKHVWADSFQRDVKDVLALQSEVAQTIARAVGARLTPQGQERLAKATRPVLPAAYDAYVRGRHEWNKRKVANLHEAIKIFQESIDADPTYAPAYAGMADCYAALGYGNALSPEDSFPRARAAAERALELDPHLAEAHASLGYALMYYDWNFRLAEKEFQKAIELNPSSALGHQWYAYLLMAMGRPKESLAQVDVAKQLDPLSVPIHIDQAYMLYYDSQIAAALKEVGMALEMDPKYPIGHFWLGRIYTMQGKFAEAEAEFQQIGDLRAWTPAMAAMGFLYGKWGKREKAEAILEEFAALEKEGKYASGYAIAVVYAGLGDKEQTFVYLDKAYAERSHWLVWLNHDPRWDIVRAEPRFKDLVRKVGLPASK
jgi:serine/threonine protein kinase/tetratricopeptide (TPR) repeat protein